MTRVASMERCERLSVSLCSSERERGQRRSSELSLISLVLCWRLLLIAFAICADYLIPDHVPDPGVSLFRRYC